MLEKHDFGMTFPDALREEKTNGVEELDRTSPTGKFGSTNVAIYSQNSQTSQRHGKEKRELVRCAK